MNPQENINCWADSKELESPKRVIYHERTEKRETKKLLFTLSSTKAPGFDSFIGEFYQIFTK